MDLLLLSSTLQLKNIPQKPAPHFLLNSLAVLVTSDATIPIFFIGIGHYWPKISSV